MQSVKIVLKYLRDELTELKDSSAGMREQWDSEKETLRGIQDKREKLDRFRRELEEAENRFDLNKAAELSYGKIPTLEQELHELEAPLYGQSGKSTAA